MIITREWLKEFIDLDGVDSEKLCRVLNSIGLEVDSLNKIRVPKGVVVGKVLECQKHPNADKLNITQVDLGNETKQIVCGAKNVAKGLIVAVATVGANLGDGFVIKEAQLRGVDSFGMICGSNEIGLPKLNDGIWVLDESLGELELGKELCEIDSINDDVIEIELTANRGDCLSIYGVARDLSAALNKELKKPSANLKEVEACKIDIDPKIKAELGYSKIDRKNDSNALIDLRLGFVELYTPNTTKNLLSYTSHATGVLLRSYNSSCKEVELKLEEGLPKLYIDGKFKSIVGVNQEESDELDKELLIEASYIDPDFISKSVMNKDLKKDDLFYNSSRGSESDLVLGFSYLAKISNLETLDIFVSKKLDPISKNISITFDKIDSFIGQKIEPDRVVEILKNLRFGVQADEKTIKIDVPRFRHDVENEQDIIEEIVRVVGIDNIPSTSLLIEPKYIYNTTYNRYKRKEYFRKRASGASFYEVIHYFFDSKDDQKRFNQILLKDELDLVNPISSELNTLRTSLLLHMLRSASSNIKNGIKSIKLFEIGTCVDENRNEMQKMAFIVSGDSQSESIQNQGKPKSFDLISFASLLRQVIGGFSLKKSEQKSALFNPYEIADILVDGKSIGVLGSLHIDLQEEFNLPKSYICEIDFESLAYEKIEVTPYSKYPKLERDLSLLKSKDLPFSKIRDSLN